MSDASPNTARAVVDSLYADAWAALGEATDWPAHHDRIFMVIHLGGQGGSEGGDEGDEGGE